MKKTFLLALVPLDPREAETVLGFQDIVQRQGIRPYGRTGGTVLVHNRKPAIPDAFGRPCHDPIGLQKMGKKGPKEGCRAI
jgi:hypothetical protein